MTKKKSTTSFSALYEELEKLTNAFENGDFDLDEGIEKFERGLEIARQLKERLRSVEQKVEKLKKQFDRVDAAETTRDDED